MIIKVIGIIVLLYVLSFIIVPNHIFYTKIRKTKEIENIAKKLKSRDKGKTLKNVYSYIINHFSNERYNFILRSYKLFFSDVERLLKRKQFAQCTLQNLALITLLVNTGQFNENDFKRKWTIIHGVVLHQYVLVEVKDKVFRLDPLLRKIKRI